MKFDRTVQAEYFMKCETQMMITTLESREHPLVRVSWGKTGNEGRKCTPLDNKIFLNTKKEDFKDELIQMKANFKLKTNPATLD